jgi:hypothetical protein
MNNIQIYEVEPILKLYLDEHHPVNSNGFIIRISNNLINNYEERKSYIVTFPINYLNDYDSIINPFLKYILDKYELDEIVSIVSIDPLKFTEEFNNINIKFSGKNITPESIIRALTIDIIEYLNIHLMETYIDEYHPDIDICEPDHIEKFNEIFDDIDVATIHEKFPKVEIYVPIHLKTEEIDETIYLNGTIKTNSQYIDIINDIRENLDTDDLTEILTYDKEEIIYKFKTNKELEPFMITINADV